MTATTSSAGRRVLTMLARGVTGLVLVAVALAAVAVVLPVLRGEPSPLVIVSGRSMDPTFHTGDLVIAWPAERYEVGEVAPYRVPEGEPGAGGLVIHRVIGGNGTDGYVMQGDNNPSPDVWMPRDGDIIGRQVLLVPRVGELMAWLRQPVVLAAAVAGLLTAAAVASAPSDTRAARRREDGDPEEDGDADGDGTVIDLRAPATDRPDDAPASPRAPHGSPAPSA